jgi:hypothetical protein
MTSVTYILSAAFWFGLGIIAGVLWTRPRRDVHRTSRRLHEEVTVPAQKAVPDQPARRPRRWPRYVLDTIVVLLFLASGIYAYVTYDQIREVQNCQRIYQTGFADALEARQPAATAEKEALVKWVTTIDELITQAQPDPIAGRQKFATATRDYLQKQAELVKTQKERPYPPFPRDVCG